jgi:hypothetical protein
MRATIITLVAIILCATAHFGVRAAPDDNSPPTDAQLIANCIAEYDYQYPERSRLDNLVISLELCR